jgi:hypothetical protein
VEYQAFRRRNYGTSSHEREFWEGCESIDELFQLPETDIRWVTTKEELVAELEKEYPSESPVYGRVFAVHNGVELYSEPIAHPTDTEQDVDELAVLLRTKRVVEVRSYSDNLVAMLEKQDGCFFDGDRKAHYSPSRKANRDSKRETSPLAAYSLRKATKGLIEEVLKHEDFARKLLLAADKGNGLPAIITRFLGSVQIITALTSEEKVLKAETTQRLLTKWRRNKSGNVSKYLRVKGGEDLVAWFDFQSFLERIS